MDPLLTSVISAVAAGVAIALAAVGKFFFDVKRDPKGNNDQLRILGAALGDTQAINGITNELREVRIVLQRHLDRTDALIEAIKDIGHSSRPRQR